MLVKITRPCVSLIGCGAGLCVGGLVLVELIRPCVSFTGCGAGSIGAGSQCLFTLSGRVLV